MALTDRIEIQKRIMPIFIMIGTSGSMAGEKINSINLAMKGIIPLLTELSKENPDQEIKVAVMEFSSCPNWLTNGLVELEKFRWKDMETSGIADFGKACKELDEKLSWKTLPGGFNTPAIILISDGVFFDDFNIGLQQLKRNGYFRNSVQVAIAMCDDANQNNLVKFSDSTKAILTVHTTEEIIDAISIIVRATKEINQYLPYWDTNSICDMIPREHFSAQYLLGIASDDPNILTFSNR